MRYQIYLKRKLKNNWFEILEKTNAQFILIPYFKFVPRNIRKSISCLEEAELRDQFKFKTISYLLFVSLERFQDQLLSVSLSTK